MRCDSEARLKQKNRFSFIIYRHFELDFILLSLISRPCGTVRCVLGIEGEAKPNVISKELTYE